MPTYSANMGLRRDFVEALFLNSLSGVYGCPVKDRDLVTAVACNCTIQRCRAACSTLPAQRLQRSSIIRDFIALIASRIMIILETRKGPGDGVLLASINDRSHPMATHLSLYRCSVPDDQNTYSLGTSVQFEVLLTYGSFTFA